MVLPCIIENLHYFITKTEFYIITLVLLNEMVSQLLFCWQVAERALFLWNNDHIRTLITQNRQVILPIIFPAMEENTRNHWNQAVRSLTLNVRKIFSDVDQELFDECLATFQEDETKEKETQVKRESTWKRLEDVAASKALNNEAGLVSRFASSIAIPTSQKPGATSGS